MANITYTVKSGDSLSKIAEKYINDGTYAGKDIYGDNGVVNILADLNDIDNVDLIYVGQKLIIKGDAVEKKKNTSSKANVKHFGYQSNSNGKLFAIWQWDKENTKEYTVWWEYNVGDGFWWEGRKTNVTVKQDLYDIPANAEQIRFRVKPIAKTRKVNNKDVAYWTAVWSTIKTYSVSNNPPSVPGKPNVEIDADCKLTASVSVSGLNAKIIQFEVYQDNKLDKVVKSGKVNVTNIADEQATHSWVVTPGHEYCVKARAYNNGIYSDWSDPSDSKPTVPPTPANLTQVEFIYEYNLLTEQPSDWATNYKTYYEKSEDVDVYEAVQGRLDVGTTSFIAPAWEANKYYSTNESTRIKLSWSAVNTATSYEIQYSKDQSVFGTSAEPSPIDVGNVTTYIIANSDNLSSEFTYYVRYRAKNAAGESKWSELGNTTSGTGPAAPTTWSSSNTAVIGEPLKLYWLHNSANGSKQTYAKLRMWVNGGLTIVDELLGPYSGDNANDVKTYEINTSDGKYSDGAKIEWCVKTAGESGGYGDWSATRVVYIYRQPVLSLSVTDASSEAIDTLESFPMFVSTSVDGGIQTPIGYHVSVIANEGYDTVDNIGSYKRVNAGDQVYSRYFDDLDEPGYFDDNKNLINLGLSGGDLTLENNHAYTVKCSVTMDSGLSAEESAGPITVAWADEFYEPNAEMFIDEDSYALSIRPYCEDENGTPIENVILSVYRRDFDGKFTEIATNISNTPSEFITDPHPALDYGRYRVVAKNISTGKTYYTDLPDFPINCEAAIIQWDEAWRDLGVGSDTVASEPTWAGSMIKLPYNIDISESTKPDVSLIKYIGRENPVSYYGTHLGTTSSWSMVIPATDVDTLYQLRRLSVYTGDVYVRAPSGLGYWANINVSLNEKHMELTIPVTISVTRVEGGV